MSCGDGTSGQRRNRQQRFSRLDATDESRVFGDSLPPGLRLLR